MSIFNEPNRRVLLKGIGAAATGTLLGVGGANARGLFEVNMQLGWLASNGILGEVAADKLGYYEDAGLSLKIIAGGPNIDGVATVASGRANLGSISSSPSLMLARAAGIPIKCIAAGYQQHPFTYFSLKDNPVNSPADLIGKTVGTQGTARILLRALLAKNGISEDDVNVTVMGGDMAALMTGQVDVVTGWNTNINALSVLGDQRNDMTLWDAGIQLYANPFYVTDQTLSENRKQVEDMIRVSAKGWGWVHDNPEQAVEFLVERYPNLNLESEKKAVSLIRAFSFNENTAQNGWGTMTRENWEAQINIYDQLGQFEGNAPKLDDLVDFSVLEATAADRPKFG
ncbi:ABC transporter substrate-binding protein [Pseudovibrio sp. Tun.PSC04-5.I4]|uniref:ABC transporter substrate-binding protein n=1 Tax=Pseudovibrio sp. Tun.PSC04-5.I4 TaxID=1798213 RepID=UPI0008924A15|nr:ABC transporter substrate-binding protein [Pseudovibrio sp. Tun.PSC04-5.I4]SDR00767.1 NitT/TauT family transport system substrate-binding protein [Pseudovibrio sp. Tun.PSC04-5.I4]